MDKFYSASARYNNLLSVTAFSKSGFSLLIILITIFIVSCSGSGSGSNNSAGKNDGEAITINLSIPEELKPPLVTGLKAQLILDGGSPIDLLVDEINNTISGIFENIATGVHTIVIHYIVTRNGVDIILATVSKTVTVTAGTSTELLVSDSDLNKNFDDDNDGFTNLAEIKIGTDANNVLDVPGVETRFDIGGGSHDIVSTPGGYTLQSRIGDSTAGKVESINYQIELGFDTR